MNNLPLQPLVWFELENTNRLICEVVTPICEYSVWKDVDSVAYSVLYYNRHTEAPTKEATGFATIDEAKTWVWNHYNEKMQPYVKPTPTWISVDDRLPNELKTVLITYEADLNFKPRKFMTFALREGGDWLGIDDIFGGYVFDDEYNADKFNDDLHGFNITHWMPIPEFSTMQNLHKGE